MKIDNFWLELVGTVSPFFFGQLFDQPMSLFVSMFIASRTGRSWTNEIVPATPQGIPWNFASAWFRIFLLPYLGLCSPMTVRVFSYWGWVRKLVEPLPVSSFPMSGYIAEGWMRNSINSAAILVTKVDILWWVGQPQLPQAPSRRSWRWPKKPQKLMRFGNPSRDRCLQYLFFIFG